MMRKLSPNSRPYAPSTAASAFFTPALHTSHLHLQLLVAAFKLGQSKLACILHNSELYFA